MINLSCLTGKMMKHTCLLSAALLTGTLAIAQDVGRVISSTPIVQQFAVPRKVCTTQQVAVQPPKSGAGALLGAIAGGAMGNAVGDGGGRAAATMIGIMGGAIIGDGVEGAPTAQLQNVEHCQVQNFYENRTTAYNVVYEYAGKQYTVQMPQDPGPTLPLQVAPMGALHSAAAPIAPVATVTELQPVYVQPGVVVVDQRRLSDHRNYLPPVRMDFVWQYPYGGHRQHGGRGGDWR